MQLFIILLAILAVFSMAVDADTVSTAKPRRKISPYRHQIADGGVHWGPRDTGPIIRFGK